MQERNVRTTPDLFTPVEVGALTLRNRIVMAPLTRSRAGPGNVPHQLNALYYAQRASAGLIISEATQIAPEGQGYIATPGIHSAEQIEGWKCVTRRGACRRRPDRAATLACRPHLASVVPARRRCADRRPRPSSPRRAGLHGEGFEPIPTPRALETGEVAGDRHAICARRAQCARRRVRRRRGAWRERLSDRSVPARPHQQADRPLWRQHREPQRASCSRSSMRSTAAVGAERTGVAHLAAKRAMNDIADSDPQALFDYVSEQLSGKGSRLSPCDRGRHGGRGRSVIRLSGDQGSVRRGRHRQ